ncbi:MAG: AMP-binding protein [Lachnospiraceae bacterium]|nr:AMP-binding protein [Lachnospiraceae bacterium]
MNKNIFADIHKFEKRHIAITESESIRYNEILEAGKVMSNGIETRSFIFHVCSNTIGSLCGYIDFIRANHVQLLLGNEIGHEKIKRLLLLYQPQYLYLPKELADGYPNYEKIGNAFEYTLFKLNNESAFDLHDELLLLLPTSGSTGSPKYVRLSHQNVKANAEAIVSYLEINENERPITILPMSYSYGLSIINSHILVGATLLLSPRKIFDSRLWDFFNKNVATSISGTPYTYGMLKKMGFLNMNFKSLKTMTQAGGKLSNELQEKFSEYAHKHMIKFFVMYGQTEATARISYLPCDKAGEKIGSIGIAIPGGQLSLVREDGSKIIGPNEVGEIIYHGTNVSLGYAECGRDLSKGDERKKTLFTGDLGRRDEDGYFYVVGRNNRFIKIFGNRVNLDEIEANIKTRFELAGCACSGKEDMVLIFVTTENLELKHKIKDFIARDAKINPIAITVKYINEIPVDGSGKVMYKQLYEENA